MKINILHIQLLPLLSGVQNVMINLFEEINMDTFKFYVISAPGGPLIKRLEDLHVKYFPIKELERKISPFKDIIVAYRIYKICLKKRFDIVHTHSSKTGFLGRIAAKMAGIRVIIHTVHGFPFHTYQDYKLRFFYKMLEKFAAYFCDQIISVNKSERKIAIDENVIKSNKIITIYNGVAQKEVTNSNLTYSIPFDESDTIIGSVCRFSEQKNIINTIKVAVQVVKNREKVNFIFLGDGELWKEAKRIVGTSNTSNRILLPGWQEDIQKWFKIFDLFLLYSRWEGLPLSILEAMSAGKPILASNIKGNNELVIDGKNGFLVDVTDNEKLQERIIWFTTHKEESKRMASESRKIAKKKFSMNKFANSYQNLYYKLYKKKL